jgi:serine protease inhibitor
MKLVEVGSALPKFRIEDRYDLTKVLAKTGLGSLCDFANRKDGLCIDEAFYTSSISVSGESVSVSSQTSMALCRDERLRDERAGVEHPCDDFVCDNPFLFFVRNRRTKLILFMGKLVVPNETN